MKKMFAAAMLLGALAGCATPPEKIAAVSMPDEPWASMTCEQLAAEKIANDRELAASTSTQDKAVVGDAVGVFLIGVPVASLAGKDLETQIAVSKGKAESIRRAQIARKCAL